jgi:small subunit ribosomal protein S6
MAEQELPLYEGMFLLNQQEVATNFGGCVDFLKGVFERAGAEVIVLTKWDERRLAYPIRGQKRGLYMLAYFRCAGGQIVSLERDCNLSDQVLRCMVVRADHFGEPELELARKDATDLDTEIKTRAESAAAAEEEQQRRYGVSDKEPTTTTPAVAVDLEAKVAATQDAKPAPVEVAPKSEPAPVEVAPGAEAAVEEQSAEPQPAAVNETEPADNDAEPAADRS